MTAQEQLPKSEVAMHSNVLATSVESTINELSMYLKQNVNMSPFFLYINIFNNAVATLSIFEHLT
jgi:hypothetical protein